MEIFEQDSDELSLKDSEIHRKKVIQTAFREGILLGKESVLQDSFDAGFSWALEEILGQGVMDHGNIGDKVDFINEGDVQRLVLFYCGQAVSAAKSGMA